ncbi:hypothetical protein PISMIDRAFT_676005 [Pisolithus microcarpus 441]|uniref:Uncharacterized protein n=1 Tax=Pisolithus microcarpus 441 TaxID=765257 RepID=A0A0C9YNK1_9AGAM|nr:hypothetical protein PISMIDRAFT_676005 [Pisolithus microcarpus 441]
MPRHVGTIDVNQLDIGRVTWTRTFTIPSVSAKFRVASGDAGNGIFVTIRKACPRSGLWYRIYRGIRATFVTRLDTVVGNKLADERNNQAYQ